MLLTRRLWSFVGLVGVCCGTSGFGKPLASRLVRWLSPPVCVLETWYMCVCVSVCQSYAGGEKQGKKCTNWFLLFRGGLAGDGGYLGS